MKKLYSLLWVLLLFVFLCWCENSNNIGDVENLNTNSTWEVQNVIDNNCWNEVKFCKDWSEAIMNPETCEFELCPEEIWYDEFSYPSRVSELWISAPKNMKLDEESFSVINEKDWSFDYFYAKYYWDYDTALDEWDKIADSIWTMYYSYLEDVQNLDSQLKDFFWDVDGAMYTNYTLTDNPESKYMITISVDTTWIMEIEVVDWAARDRKNW